jgi:hypothetical protein
VKKKKTHLKETMKASGMTEALETSHRKFKTSVMDLQRVLMGKSRHPTRTDG